MLEIYMVRHGETAWNVEKRLQGWLDSPLTEKGISAAKNLGDALRDVHFDAFYCSPSGRAAQTLKVAFDHLTEEEVCYDKRLMEINLGNWQGKNFDEIRALYPDEYEKYMLSPTAFDRRDGENYQDVYDRVTTFLKEMTEKEQEKGDGRRILIVSHGLTLMILQLIFAEEPVSAIANYSVSKNATHVIYQYDGERYKRIGDAAPTQAAYVTF